MNFGSKYTLHDSDEEEEVVHEDAIPGGCPLSSISVGRITSPSPVTAAAPQQQQRQEQQERVRLREPTAVRGYGWDGGGDIGGGAGPPPPSPRGSSRFAFGMSPPLPAPAAATAPALSRTLAPTPMSAWSTMTAARPFLPPRTWTRKVDTNILNVDMAALGNAAPVATGDPIFCSGCRACLSVVSILRPAGTETNGDDQSQPAVASGPGTAAPCLGVLTEETPTDLSSSVMRLGASGEHECTPATGHHGATEVEEGVYDWTCEFCGTENSGIELDCMEKPVEGQESVDFVLEPAPASVAAAAARMSNEMGGGANHDESAVLFVIDTSGSMCVTAAVEGRVALRGDRTKDMRQLLGEGDARNQIMPGQRSGFTYVSRLQSMQAAIDAQLETMLKSAPNRHAGIVTFSGEVTLIGDGSVDARVVAGDRLSDAEALGEVGRAYPLSQPVSQSRERLAERLFALEEGGPTALGPAVVAGLAMLKERGGRGSRMVVCTDGLANVGLGALDDLKNDDARTAAEAFYENLGRASAESGVTVDVVTVDSDACDLENLGALSEMSGGTVTKVKASELAANFAGILANPILASQVSVRVTLHKGLMFRNADTNASANTLERDVGNVTRETELSFEYQVRPRAEREALGISTDGVLSSAVRHKGRPIAVATAPPAVRAVPATSAKSADIFRADAGKGADAEATKIRAYLPFQVQIRYTRPDGMKCVRVLTKTRRVTRSKREAEEAIQMAVIAGHATSEAGRMAGKGAYQSTRVSMRAWSNVMQRSANSAVAREQVTRYGTVMAQLDSELVSAQQAEGTLDADEGGSVNERTESATKGKRRKSARSRTNDNLSFLSYAARGTGSKGFKE